MTAYCWRGGIDGGVVFADSESVEVRDIRSLMSAVRDRSFSRGELNLLGRILFLLALRDAINNDPVLPAANKVLDGALAGLADAAAQQQLKAGIEVMRDEVFPFRHFESREVVKKGFAILMKDFPA